MTWDAAPTRYRGCNLFVRWSGDLGRCRFCDSTLTGRRRTWCSSECQDTYADNHFWTQAPPARIALDGYRCVRCGDGPGHPPPNPFYISQFTTQQKALRQHVPLEVHHLYPIGRVLSRYGTSSTPSGCHNHLSLLVTLCRSCHLRETKAEKQIAKARRLLQTHPQLADQVRAML